MCISKIVFKNLSTKTLSYTAIGGIRFYDENDNEIDILGSTIIENSLRTFETDKVKITATNTYSNGDNYNVGNAFRNDRPQTGQFGNKHYWLSAYDNQTITVYFKNCLPCIKRVEFNPRPDSRYTNRGIDQEFIIEFYDENDNLLRSYNITPNYTVINYIQNIDTSVLCVIKKVLFCKNTDGSIWKFDVENNKWIQLTDYTIDSITAEDILNNGNNIPLKITKDTLLQLGTNIKILSSIKSNTGVSSATVSIKANPQTQLVVQNNPISLYDYESINMINIDANIDNGLIKLLIGRDINKWYAWNGREWILIKEDTLDINNPDDIKLVYENGIAPDTLKNLTWNQYKLLYLDNNGEPDKIIFAFILQNINEDDNVSITNISLNVTPRALWQDVTNECEILQGDYSITITFNSNGTYIVNYQD